MVRGLTLGKFAPLHRGHQLLIETGREESDELTVLVYDAPDVTRIPVSVRAGWIRNLYPDVRVIEAYDCPLEVGESERVKKLHEDYILHTLGISSTDTFFSSEFYGEHMSVALSAKNRIVDADRKRLPISGTEIRKNPYENRKYLSPIVYRDLIRKLVFLGGPSTGKSTLAEYCARTFQTEWQPEYGREYWETFQVERRLTPDQLLELAQGHLEREEKQILSSREFLFVDTNPITTYLFSLYYHGFAVDELEALADQSRNRYDLFLLCDTDIPYEDTEDRSGDGNRIYFQERTIEYLNSKEIQFETVSGSLNERLKQVEFLMKSLEPIFL